MQKNINAPKKITQIKVVILRMTTKESDSINESI